MSQTPVDNFQQAFLELQRAYFRQDGTGEIVEWARQQAPEVFEAYRQAHQKLEDFWDEHRQYPPIAIAEEADQHHQTEKLLQEWARIQPDAQNVIDRLEEFKIGGRYWRHIFPYLQNPSAEFVRKAFLHTQEWNALAQNPNLEQPQLQQLVQHCAEMLAHFENTYRAGINSGKRKYTRRRLKRRAQQLLEQFIEERNPENLFTRASIEELIAGATYSETVREQRRQHFDIEQEERPAKSPPDEVLEKLWAQTQMLRKDDLLTIVQHYRINSWAARGLVKEYGDDMSPEEWTLLARRTGDYEARKMMVAHPKGQTLPEVREALDDSQGFEVQVELMRTAQGSELGRRLGQLLDSEPDETLEWLRSHEIQHPEDLNPQDLLEHLQSEDRQRRLQAITVAAQMDTSQKPSSPTSPRSR